MVVLLNPSFWTGLFSLVVIEIVLSIDNLIFLSILSEKLPSVQRKQARYLGVIISVIMRISLLLIVSWILSVNRTFLLFKNFSISIRKLILILGGSFLIFKSISELLEKITYVPKKKIKKNKKKEFFWSIVSQIVILDALFSLDSMITAIGITQDVTIMSLSIIISSIIMLFISNKFAKFIKSNPKISLICLLFLLVIGINLFLESLNIHISPSYLYFSVIFTLLIEILNNTSQINYLQYQRTKPIRQRLVETVENLIFQEKNFLSKTDNVLSKEEKYIINNIFSLSKRTVKYSMTPRKEISWININDSIKKNKKKIFKNPYNIYPVCKNNLENTFGIVQAKQIIPILKKKKKDIINFSLKYPATIISETLSSISLLKFFKDSKQNACLVADKFGIIQGIVTPLDLLKSIVGDIPKENKNQKILTKNNSWIVKGSEDILSIQNLINSKNKKKDFLIFKTSFSKHKNYLSLAKFLIQKKGRILKKGEKYFIGNFQFYILKSTQYAINLVKITKLNCKKNKTK